MVNRDLTLDPAPTFTVMTMDVMTGRPGGLRVGEVAEAVGVGRDTIRYYERAGLLPKPSRTPGG